MAVLNDIGSCKVGFVGGENVIRLPECFRYSAIGITQSAMAFHGIKVFGEKQITGINSLISL
jgi:hypothetical protein